MTVLLVTTCTNRKLGRARSATLTPSCLALGSQIDVTEQWLSLVEATPTCDTAKAMYGGRGFKEALATLTPESDSLWIISAGLGLINSRSHAPAYNLTVSPGTPHSIQSRISIGSFCAKKWWSDLNSQLQNKIGLTELVRDNPNSTVVITLSSAYAKLVCADLEKLEPNDASRVRIVGLSSERLLPEMLRACWMPYDIRFDGPDCPIPGTRADYPQRVTRHFVQMLEKIGENASISAHRASVLESLRYYTPRLQPVRTQGDDDKIRSIIVRRWNDAKGSSTRMLRILRDQEMVSCEQGRFAKLFRSMKMEIDG